MKRVKKKARARIAGRQDDRHAVIEERGKRYWRGQSGEIKPNSEAMTSEFCLRFFLVTAQPIHYPALSFRVARGATRNLLNIALDFSSLALVEMTG
ncbi:MAG: hypothetical protein IPG44_12960 [Anaerolineales bacterium]|nr:hypothetical protein [Anaerolineales bacterium]